MVEMRVIKKDGSKEPYNRSKIKTALTLAFAKREYAPEHIDQMIDALEVKRSYRGSEIQASRIGDDLLAMLKDTDEVAYIRYASVYQAFDGVEDFRKIVKGG
jgi:transcriptional repressor NrdR